MQLPIDISKVKKVVSQTSDEQNVFLQIVVCVDHTANPELVSHIETLFSPNFKSANVRVVDFDDVDQNLECNFCIIVSAKDDAVSGIYKQMRSKKTKCAVVTLNPHYLYSIDGKFKNINRRQNIICPNLEDFEKDEESGKLDSSVFTKAMESRIQKRLIGWLILKGNSHMISLAYNFDFMRNTVSKYVIHVEAMKNAGVGLVPFGKSADMPIMTLNQASMLVKLAAIYGNEVDLKLVPEIACVVVCGFGLRYIASGTKKHFKNGKLFIASAFGFLGTEVLGFALQASFKRGATFYRVFEEYVKNNSALKILNKK